MKEQFKITTRHFYSFLSSTTGKQSGFLFGSQILNTFLGILVYGILTRTLSVEQFGTYTFIMTVFVFSSVFFDFGLSSAGMRLMALCKTEQERRERFAALFILASFIGLGLSFFIASVSFLIDPLFHQSVGSYVLLLAPLSVFLSLQELILITSQGSNQISTLSAMVVLPRIVLVPLLWMAKETVGISLLSGLSITLGSTALVVLFLSARLRPRWNNLRSEFSLIRKEVREFGKDIYLGRAVDGLTNGIDRLAISFFHGMVPLGFYSIAITMTSPIAMFSRSLSASAYKDFAHNPILPKRILVANVTWCLAASIVLVFACETMIPLFFTTKYSESLTVLPYIAIGIALSGLNAPYHAFLAARREGKAIKIMSITTSGLNIVLNIVLIPFLSMIGAGLALIVTYSANIVMNLYFYQKYRRSLLGGNMTNEISNGQTRYTP